MKLHKTAVAAMFIASVATAHIAYAHPPVPISHPAPAKRLVFDTRKFMPISEVRPGMRGYALTVFKGTKIEKFDVEILGVVSKFNMGKDYILFRALDGPSVTRGLNIAHGMSGSPIYVNGRLLGAISMGIPGILGAPSFPKEPMALATPIEEMFDAWSPDLPKNPAPISATPDTVSNEQSTLSSGALSHFSPLDLPVVVSGVNSRGVHRLADELAPYHLDVFAGGGSGASTATNPLAKNANLNPGASVGVALAQGDVDVTAIGTVTYRDGNRLLIFGHPLADLGPIDAALTTSYVVDVYPSYQDSVKIGAPIKTVGRIFQDRPFSVGGVIGPLPHMIPVTVDVNDLSLKKHQTFHSSVINHPLLTARLIEMVADQAISQIHGEPGDTMATVKMDVDAEEVGHIVRTNTFYDAQSIDQTALGDLSSALQLLSANPFYPLSVKSVNLSVTIQTRHDTAEIDHIFLKQSKFAPGDTVDVGVVLKPFKQPLTTHIVQVKIPADAPTGTIELQVKGGAAEAGGGAISIGGLLLLRPSTDQQSFATNVEQLVKEFNKKPRNNEIVAHLLLPTRALSVNGEKLSNLPPTIVNAMQSNRTTGLHTERDEVKVAQPTKYIISGSQSLSITVAKKEVVEPAHGAVAPPPPAPTPAPANAGSDALDDGDALSSTGQGQEHPADALSAGNAGVISMTAYTAGSAHPMPNLPPPPVMAAAPRTPGSPTAPPAPTVTVQGNSAQKPVGHVASVWLQSSAADFLAGTLQNTAVASTGGVVLSRPLTKLAETSANYAWSIAPGPGNNVYVGTGDNGTIYKMDPSGKLSVFYQTGELEVTSLTTDADGTLYAGTIPDGVVYRITPDGHGAKWYTAPEKYVTALAYDRAGKRLFVATGGGTAKVYAVSDAPESPQAQTWLTTSEAHILSLAVDSNGVLYSGTAPNGLVYRTDLKGQSKVFYEGTEPDISGLAAGANNDVYVGSSPKGIIVHVAQNGEAKSVYDGAAGAITALAAVGSRVYATAGNSVLRIAPDDTIETYVASTDEQFVSLGASGNGDAVYVGTSNGGAVYQIGGNGKAESGTFDSALYDAGGPARWGTLTWRALTPSGAQVAVQTRSGDVVPPDASWSDWSPVYQSANGSTVTSPPARYIQYRAKLTATQNGDDTQPRLDAVSVYYLQRNEPPVVHVVSPKDGDSVSKSVNIQWTAVDPDHDTLTYDIAISGDGGKTWKPLKKRWRPVPAAPSPAGAPAAKPTTHTAPAQAAAPKTASAATSADVQHQVDAMRADLNQHPELPAAVRAQILAQAPTVIKKTEAPSGAASTDAGATNLKETSFSWDSTEVPDGTYQIQVTASDRPSEPENPLKGEAVSGVFSVDNTPPKITTAAPVVNSDKTVTVHGSATSGLVFVKAIQFQIDGGDTMAAAADDGLFDSPSESFNLTTLPLTSGTHRIDITAYDWAGNTAQTSVSVTVP
jgi:hypothetical protein